jgi:hypothetical protein
LLRLVKIALKIDFNWKGEGLSGSRKLNRNRGKEHRSREIKTD